MATLLEQQIKRAERAKAAELAAIAAGKKARAETIKANKAKAASRRKVRDMLGDTIQLAFESGDITPQEHAVISAMWTRRKDKPADRDLMKDWELPTDSTAHPANDPEPETHQPEFVRTGK
jgi:hypothetical protein